MLEGGFRCYSSETLKGDRKTENELDRNMSKSISTGLPGREVSPTVWPVKINLVSCLILLFRPPMALLSSVCYQTTTDAMRRCERETKSWAHLASG